MSISKDYAVVIYDDQVQLLDVKQVSERGGLLHRFKTNHSVGSTNLPTWGDHLSNVLKKGQTTNIFIPRLANGWGRVAAVVEKVIGGDEVKMIAVVESEPAIRNIVDNTDSFSRERLRRIAVPYTVMLIPFTRNAAGTHYVYRSSSYLSIFFSNTPLTGFDSKLFNANLPNQSGDGVCMGSNDLTGYEGKSIEQQIQIIVQEFWESPFGSAITSQWSWAKENIKNHPQSFAQWEEMTNVNPNFVVKLNWRPTEKTLKEMISANFRIMFSDPRSENSESQQGGLSINSELLINSTYRTIGERS